MLRGLKLGHKRVKLPELNSKVRQQINSQISTAPGQGPAGTCHLWTGPIGANGYGIAYLNGRYYRAHRLAIKAATGTDPGDLSVCHTCDNRRCVNPQHLVSETQLWNSHDMKAKNRTHVFCGAKNPQSKCSDAQIARLRKMAATGKYTQAQLGEKFKLHPGHVSRILRGQYRARPAFAGPIGKRPAKVVRTRKGVLPEAGKMVTIGGVSKNITAWCRELGCSRASVYQHKLRGEPVGKTLRRIARQKQRAAV